jgi:hypothetical protein
MKSIPQILALLLILQTAKADNFEWLLKLTIEQKDGSKTVGYISFAESAISKDSVKNTSYLIKMLDRLDAHQQDNAISLFTMKLEYKYKSLCDNISTYCHSFINEVSIQTKLIKKITVQSISEYSNYTEICNKLTSSDTAWIKTKPVKTVAAKGSLCLYELYFHEYNKELEKLVAQLKAQSKKAEEIGDNIKMEAILKKITRFKVLVIMNWTC